MASSNVNVLAIGASRNIGYHASIRLLNQGATVTFILRSKTAFESDPLLKAHIESGKARLIQGDATNESDARRAWAEATRTGGVDVVLCTIGATSGKMSITKGFIIDPFNLCTKALLTVLSTMPAPSNTNATPTKKPLVIFVSSTGISRSSRAVLPLPLKPLHSWMLGPAHADKRGAERVLAHCAGWKWDDPEFGVVNEAILSGNWTQGLPEPGSIRAISIKAASLTDGDCLADKAGLKGKPYRFEEKALGGAYSISRKDVGHFIVEELINKNTNYKDVSLAY